MSAPAPNTNSNIIKHNLIEFREVSHEDVALGLFCSSPSRLLGGNVLHLYSVGAYFESQPEHGLSSARFAVILLGPSRQMPAEILDWVTTASKACPFRYSRVIPFHGIKSKVLTAL